MGYQFESRVRYSEVDQKQTMTLNAVINYFQDCSTFHSEEVGLGIDFLAKAQGAWVLSFWQIVLHRLPKFGEKILVQTWPYDFKGFYGSRNFTMLSEDQTPLVAANSIWVYVDLKTGHPVRVPKEQREGYALEERLEMDYVPRKIAVSEESVEMPPCSVLKYQLDTNNHVNNGQYVLMASEFLPDHFQVRQVRAEYKKAALLHDVILPKVHLEETSCTVALCDTKGLPYAIVAFDQ